MTFITRYGVHGDPLHEGKLDLPELRETPTRDELEWTKDFIARRNWREAVTYRDPKDLHKALEIKLVNVAIG
jgi:hypothetical protein